MDRLRTKYHDFLERRFLRRLRPAAEYTLVEKRAEQGRTVLALEGIPAGTVLGIYPGVQRLLCDLQERQDFAEKSMRYAYYLSDGVVLDPSDLFGNVPDRPQFRLALINEPPPGHRVNVFPVPSRRHIWYLVLSDIAEGEELFTTYGPNYYRTYPSPVAEHAEAFAMSPAEREIIRRSCLRYPWLIDS